ncbi:MAG: phosphomannomutase/phosphoglucomutase [Alphaproteobacteria bacterium]|nr:phosphomannomutase/phosphoglucomutase [Alphaproteobacteria bacterium]
MARHAFDPSILREYDIRGVVGETLSAADAFSVGQAFGAIVARGGGRTVYTGYDGRLSSPELEAALVEGLIATGLQAVRAGLGPTPMLYYAVLTAGADGGIMVTGSHNPANYNGFKLMLGKKPFFGPDIQALGAAAARGVPAVAGGHVTSQPVTEAYVATLASAYRGSRPLAIVWDAGNGAAGAVLRALTEALPGRHILLNDAVDGTFPAHHPDPTVPENLRQLQDAVAAEKADVGIAFDGDGDRIGVIDERGRILWGDQLLALFAREILRERPGAVIMADVKASQVLFDEIRRLGGQPLMWRTGHSHIKAKMAEVGAPLAGEMSGHIFFADRYLGFDDALYAAVRVVSMVSSQADSLAALRDSLPIVLNTPEIRIPCEDARKFAVVEEVRARLAAAGAMVDPTDGVRVSGGGGWWLLRASNTQPVLVARVEAESPAALARLEAALSRELAASGVALPAS